MRREQERGREIGRGREKEEKGEGESEGVKERDIQSVSNRF